MKKLIKIFLKRYKLVISYIFTKFIRLTAKEVKGKLSVNHYSKVNKNTVLGNNVNFNGLIINGIGSVKIGNNFHSGRNCLLITQIHNYNNATKIPYDETYILKPIVIEDNVWLGDRVIILGGTQIGEGAIIQAGSVVVKDIPKYSIAGGHPAEVFSYRDIKHYEELKKLEKFH
jgi:chloramphenicol O-acetyltransferase type B